MHKESKIMKGRESMKVKSVLNVLMHKESKIMRRRETAMLHLLIKRDSYKKQRGENMTRISMLAKVVILNESSNDSSKAQARTAYLL